MRNEPFEILAARTCIFVWSFVELTLSDLHILQHGKRLTTEHKVPEPMADDLGSSKQVPTADANSMAINAPGNAKNEPGSSLWTNPLQATSSYATDSCMLLVTYSEVLYDCFFCRSLQITTVSFVEEFQSVQAILDVETLVWSMYCRVQNM